MKFIKLIFWFYLSFLLVHCSQRGTSTGNPMKLVVTGSAQSATVAMNIIEKFWNQFVWQMAEALTPPALQDANGSAVVLSDAWLSVENIELKIDETAGSGEVDGSDVYFQGPYFIDLLDANPSPLGIVSIPFLQFHRIKMKLNNSGVIPPSAPVGLSGNSIYLAGTVGGVAFTFSSPDNMEYEVAGPNGIYPSGGNFLMVIRVARLFDRIDLSAISAPTNIDDNNRVSAANPCPLINASANDLYTCFREGMQSEANFGVDSGDNDLSSGESAVK